MCLALKSKGIHCNPKTILRVMKKYDLLSEIRRRRKWVNMGQQLHRYENLLNHKCAEYLELVEALEQAKNQ